MAVTRERTHVHSAQLVQADEPGAGTPGRGCWERPAPGGPQAAGAKGEGVALSACFFQYLGPCRSSPIEEGPSTRRAGLEWPCALRHVPGRKRSAASGPYLPRGDARWTLKRRPRAPRRSRGRVRRAFHPSPTRTTQKLPTPLTWHAATDEWVRAP